MAATKQRFPASRANVWRVEALASAFGALFQPTIKGRGKFYPNRTLRPKRRTNARRRNRCLMSCLSKLKRGHHDQTDKLGLTSGIGLLKYVLQMGARSRKRDAKLFGGLAQSKAVDDLSQHPPFCWRQCIGGRDATEALETDVGVDYEDGGGSSRCRRKAAPGRG